MQQIFKTLIIGLTGGYIFTLLHIPLSWMLGSMTFAFLSVTLFKQELVWPSIIRNLGLIIVGYTIGFSFSKHTLVEMIHHLPSMAMMTIAIIGFSSVLAFITSKITGVNYQSTLTGSIPGGLSQMVNLSEELKNVDITIVTVTQLMRIICVIFIVPFIALSPFLNKEGHIPQQILHSSQSFSYIHFIFLLFAGACSFLAVKSKLPTPFLLGALIGIASLKVLEVDVPQMDPHFIRLAQVLIGTHLGLMLKFKNAGQTTKFTFLTVITSVLLILFSTGLAFILMKTHNVSILTAFISMAPGGIAEMALLGQSVQADLSVITSYHLFRILFILFVIPIILKLVFRRIEMSRKQAS
ncbi:AbrB family transcriptional regulator [Bacillus sp. 03113]|uniref:AbrB family transcriptional regulator n=1 Tax=Bacillus sp. 03113 TaxID=2578211 RepID=UPI0011450DC8|nr:AbrB family transcriptional regulator [Bacillus sp. 03113]